MPVRHRRHRHHRAALATAAATVLVAALGVAPARAQVPGAPDTPDAPTPGVTVPPPPDVPLPDTPGEADPFLAPLAPVFGEICGPIGVAVGLGTPVLASAGSEGASLTRWLPPILALCAITPIEFERYECPTDAQLNEPAGMRVVTPTGAALDVLHAVEDLAAAEAGAPPARPSAELAGPAGCERVDPFSRGPSGGASAPGDSPGAGTGTPPAPPPTEPSDVDPAGGTTGPSSGTVRDDRESAAGQGGFSTGSGGDASSSSSGAPTGSFEGPAPGPAAAPTVPGAVGSPSAGAAGTPGSTDDDGATELATSSRSGGRSFAGLAAVGALLALVGLSYCAPRQAAARPRS